ncbi:MAG: hypothetical protein V4581_04340 [Bacteroidota bacterium]
MIREQDYHKVWPLWQRIAFRFVFCYFTLYVLSWPFFAKKPGLAIFDKLHHYIMGGAANIFNTYVMRFPGRFVAPATMNDSPYRLTQIVLFFCLAVLITIVWSYTGRRQKSYNIANYYFTTSLRYFLAFISFLYGTYKLFGLQMPVPNIADFATPLGDLTPMGLSWQQIGYSTGYQFFLGMAEVMIGGLLLYRRTVTLGLFMALGVYVNVMVINYCYDVWVKMFSAHLVLICVYLLLKDFNRLANFFVLNITIMPDIARYVPTTKAGKTARLVLKGAFIAVVFITFADRLLRMNAADTTIKPIPPGLYNVTVFVKNGDTLPVLAHDSLMWKDFIFEKKGNVAAVNTADKMFAKAGGRGIFMYKADTVNKSMACYRYKGKDSLYLFTLHYRLTAVGEIEFRTRVASDSLYFKLQKSNHKFKLAERQFHWFSDYRK